MKLNFFLIFIYIANIYSQPIFELKRPIIDRVGILKSSEIEVLENKILKLEKEKGSQIGVLIIESTEGDTIENYSIKIAEKWKLGRKGIDDGILFLIAIKDRKMRIEVGYGLEGVIPDAKAKQILDEYVKPLFKKGDYYNGIYAGIDMIEKLIRGEPLPEPKENINLTDKSIEMVFILIFVGISIFFHFIAALINFSQSKIKGIFFLLLGAILIIIFSIFLPLYIAVFLSVFPVFFLTIFTMIGSNIYNNIQTGNQTLSKHYQWGGKSTNSISWNSGGFSGGGGSFGGGGASSSW